ncbi:hypothetical protein TorRG33x02_253410 [Trema orientale]|uniref:Uncharacterized protein n=1 Tax=Trema orientale TaxID=63057 RepID=A0A2P5DEN5_TREOI|nr:hypothetical protein TorRG33x02_253410 [Trema orientale]
MRPTMVGQYQEVIIKAPPLFCAPNLHKEWCNASWPQSMTLPTLGSCHSKSPKGQKAKVCTKKPDDQDKTLCLELAAIVGGNFNKPSMRLKDALKDLKGNPKPEEST